MLSRNHRVRRSEELDTTTPGLLGYYRTYSAGYEIDHLDTSPGGVGCPFRAGSAEPGAAVS